MPVPRIVPTPALSAADMAAGRHFERGRELERLGRYDEAFAAFSEANRVKAASLNPQLGATQFAARVTALKGVFTSEFLRRHATTNRDDAPIFIVGLPRSGSTLIEQILASHPSVQGMGEAWALPGLLAGAYPFNPAGRCEPWPISQAYLDEIRQDGWGGGRFTDKQLLNTVAVGYIHLMFPRAVILHAVRNPADMCLSCFRTHFAGDTWTQFSYDLAAIGAYYRAYRQLMDHWAFVLMGRVVRVELEALIADQEGETRRLLDACGLDWDERCLRYFENMRPVFTASAEQVRRPINSDSVGLWRRYREHLKPLFTALGPYAPE